LKRITILGVTGSIGRSTADVIEELRAQGQEIEIEAVTAGRNLGALVELCQRLTPRFAAVADSSMLAEARAALAGLDVEVGAGADAVREAAERPSDWVMAAIVGAAGLAPTLAAIRRGVAVALANKECLVCAGPLMLTAAKESGAKLLPVDSEHNAIFQVLGAPERVEKLTLTASGGPFRTWSREAMAKATPAQAAAHPVWSMGAKISIDSATLFNKGLELIEAAYLFSTPSAKIEVLVHPESIIHSLVHYVDGSVLAQMGSPDMRIPISYALAWPDRAAVSTPRLDLARIGRLNFEAPDETRFPALRLCRAALDSGPGATAALNAANEIAVDAFLQNRIGFLDIAGLVEEALSDIESRHPGLIAKSPSSFGEVAVIDTEARAAAVRLAAARAR